MNVSLAFVALETSLTLGGLVCSSVGYFKLRRRGRDLEQALDDSERAWRLVGELCALSCKRDAAAILWKGTAKRIYKRQIGQVGRYGCAAIDVRMRRQAAREGFCGSHWREPLPCKICKRIASGWRGEP